MRKGIYLIPFIIGIVVLIAGAFMFASTSQTFQKLAPGIFTKASPLYGAFQGALSIPTTISGSLSQRLNLNISPSTISISFAAIGALVILISDALRENLTKPSLMPHDAPRTKAQIAMMVLHIAMSFAITWLALMLIYFLGFQAFWFTVITIILSFLILGTVQSYSTTTGNRGVAFFTFIMIIILSAFLGSIVGTLLTTFLITSVYDLTLAGFVSFIVVLLAYAYFHTMHYDEESATASSAPKNK